MCRLCVTLSTDQLEWLRRQGVEPREQGALDEGTTLAERGIPPMGQE